MNKRINWLTQENKKILHLDFSNASISESTQIWKDVEEVILGYDGGEPLLMLLDVVNVRYDKTTQDAYRKVRDKTKNIKQKWVIVGADSKTKVMIKIVCIFVKDDISFVDSIEEGKKLLLS